jgi:hypothetical protein
MKHTISTTTRWIAGMSLYALAGCGPGPVTDPDGTTQASSSSSASSMATTQAATSTSTTPPPSTTTAADSTAGSTSPGSTSPGETGIVGCESDSGGFYEPPPGCQHLYLDGADGYADPSLPSGFVACGDDSFDAIYRVARVPCAYEHHLPLCPEGGPEDCGSVGACQPGESCVDSFGYCYCMAQCNQDSDCQSGQICLCAAGIPAEDGRASWNALNRCVPADCADDCECPDGLRCRVSDDICSSPEALHCTTPADDCQAASDCKTNYCRYDEVEELWTCDSPAICE